MDAARRGECRRPRGSLSGDFRPEGDDNCLIGATTMQILTLVSDPINERLKPATRGRLGMAAHCKVRCSKM